jgi:hypothetical protein
MTKTRLKLMADYQCFPLWKYDPGYSDCDPRSLPLSAQLVADLMTWAKKYDATLDLDDPGSDRLAFTKRERDQFAQEGQLLRDRLAKELGHGYEVEYRGPGSDEYVDRDE